MSYRTRSNRWSHTTGMCFVRMDYARLSGDFNSRLTQVNTHIYAANQPGMALMSMELFGIQWDVWIKMVWWKRKTDRGDHWLF